MGERFKLVKGHCRRCGAGIVTGNRSLHGAEALGAESGGICARCITPEEEARIPEGLMRAILGGTADVP